MSRLRSSAMRRNTALADGFTLLEVLVTLVVLGLLMVTVSEGVRVGLKAWALEGRMDQRAGKLETTDRALRQLIERALPMDPQATDGFAGNPHVLSFATTLPEGYGAASTHEADVTLLVADSHRLELLWRPHYSRWIVQPPPPSVIPLVEGVQQIDFDYWQPGTAFQQGRWLTAWPTRSLPALVRLHIVFPSGDARDWPDIIVAPMRDRLSW
jgi:general secretion pathway protein J